MDEVCPREQTVAMVDEVPEVPVWHAPEVAGRTRVRVELLGAAWLHRLLESNHSSKYKVRIGV